MCTNFNAIKGANGRRYLVVDMNPCHTDDFKYFGELRDKCYNDSTARVFFCFLYKRDVSKFNSLEIPMTKSKQDLCADLLSPLEQFKK